MQNNELKNVKVLVTGATGFIGSHLTRRLVNLGANVSIITEKNPNPWRIKDIQNQIKIYECNINDKKLKDCIEKIKPQKIYHLAAFVNPERILENLDEMIEVNVNGTINLIRSLENIEYDCFIYTGTCEEYGKNKAPFTEDQIPHPVSPYSYSKVAATLFCKMYYELTKKPIIILRPFLTYGPTQDPKLLIPIVINKALHKEEIKMTKGEQTREFNYVEDIVEAYIKASTTKEAIGEIINIGNGIEYKIKDVVLKILKMMNNPIKPAIGVLPYREGEVMHFYSDNKKAKSLLNWKPKYSLEEGLKKTIEWYIKNG
jgi:nucleoside-diphosphate-sugar epimerase